jgi:hypothetical protein
MGENGLKLYSEIKNSLKGTGCNALCMFFLKTSRFSVRWTMKKRVY